MSKTYYFVSKEVAGAHGIDVAFLYAVLQNLAKIRPKDERGFFTVYSKTLRKHTGWGHYRLSKARDDLAATGLISVRTGKNQYQRYQYKING